MRAPGLFAGAAAATGVAVVATVACARAIAPWWRSWGVNAAEADEVLPGDELVPDATVADTRGIDIDAPPEAVWPWLVQMGYGRAGWYSYDAMDMRGSSANRIEPALQTLLVGDLIPTSPTTGFAVKTLQPDRALVLYVDEHLVQGQTASHEIGSPSAPSEAAPASLRLTGALMPQMPGFAASWAFVLTPLAGGTRTRLVERTRARMGPSGPGSRFALPVFGFGVFLMTRKQMLGLRQRSEATAAPRSSLVGAPVDHSLATAGGQS